MNLDPRRHIENADRGITLSKSLAWTILAGLITGGMWLGGEIASARRSIDDLKSDLAQFEIRQTELADRMRKVERQEAADLERMTAITTLLTRIDQRLETMERRLRDEELRSNGWQNGNRSRSNSNSSSQN